MMVINRLPKPLDGEDARNAILGWYEERGTDAERANAEALVDAWLEGVKREARVNALRDAAQAWRWSAWSNVPRIADQVQERIATANYVGDWLAARAETEAEGK